MGCSQSNLATEPVAVEDVAVAVETVETVEATPATTEEVVAATVAVEEAAAVEEAVAIQDAETPEVEAAPKAYVILDEIVESNGVVYYTVQAQDGTQVQKRYSEFKALHDQICKVEHCDTMPQASVWSALQRTNPKLVADRHAKFELLLNEWAAVDDNKDILAAFMAPTTAA
ncbi:Aste57867_1592 [Aphanomyces stellatus]|uniref:Aste57867_1592 protein n=1 Tax=Aphanomyces stellatus TaxID=120398 RepID=A0A485K6T6_9STRA|nr:hypothetical protein As57867_001591 [Aphanomyces stellatus]VFT78805.1 Aste57867_1592 [Aphanomyces stellatus]